jgi:hypothetical protein
MEEVKGLSTLTEVLSRGKIHEISPSTLKSGVFIVIFALGDQANIDVETYYKLVGA